MRAGWRPLVLDADDGSRVGFGYRRLCSSDACPCGGAETCCGGTSHRGASADSPYRASSVLRRLSARAYWHRGDSDFGGDRCVSPVPRSQGRFHCSASQANAGEPLLPRLGRGPGGCGNWRPASAWRLQQSQRFADTAAAPRRGRTVVRRPESIVSFHRPLAGRDRPRAGEVAHRFFLPAF